MLNIKRPIPIVLSPSQQLHNPCKMGDVEANHMRAIAEIVYNNLCKDPNFIPYLIPQLSGTDTQNLKDVVALSNKFIDQYGYGLHIAFHSDGGGGTGASAFYGSANGKILTETIYNKLQALTPWEDRGISSRPGLMEIGKTHGIATLFEISFHDNLTQANWIHEQTNVIAEAITSGIYEALGLNKPQDNPDQWVIDLINQLHQDGKLDEPEKWKNALNEPMQTKYVIALFAKAIYK